MLTDGEIAPPEEHTIVRLHALAEDVGLKTHGFIVGEGTPTPEIAAVCTHLHSLGDGGLAGFMHSRA